MHGNYNSLIQALKYHKETDINNCHKCPYNQKFCSFKLASDALEVIETLTEKLNGAIAGQETLQKALAEKSAEIKALKSRVNSLKKYDEQRDIALHARLTAEAKAEGRKELAERLKELCRQARFSVKLTRNLTERTSIVLDKFEDLQVIDESDIDNVLKEMEGVQ